MMLFTDDYRHIVFSRAASYSVFCSSVDDFI
jgi:hypothetical protein